MQRGPFAGFYLVSELPVSSDGVQRWAARHADGRQGEVLLGSTELLETASKMPQGGPWGVILRGEDEAGAWVLFPGELTCSLTQLRAKISARAAFAIGHLLLEALDSVHDAGLHHGRLSPEWVGFDSEGVLRVRARPDHAETADIDASATPQDTDCWSVGGLVYFLLGGEWPPSEVVSLPDFGGMDAGRARLALSGLLRKNPRLRLKPARFARQAVAAALQDIESAEQELRSLLAAQGCGTALRDAAPVLPGGLDTDANRTLIEAFTRVVAPEANRGSSPEPRLVEDSAPENRSPIQIELALPVAEEAVSAESGAQEASVEDVPVEEEGRLEEPPTEGSEAEAIHEGSEAEATHEGSEAEEEPEPSSGQGEEEDSSPVAEEAASDEAEQPDIEEAPASSELQESNENFEEAQPSSTQAEAGDEAVEDARLGVLEEDGSEAQSPIRVQIALPQVAPESPKEPAQEVGKQPLEVEPFRMPLPEPAESMATESESASPVEESVPAGGLESDALPAPESELEPERSEAAPAVRIQLPDLAESPAVDETVPAMPVSATVESLDPTPIPIPPPELPSEAFDEEILSEEELDALLAAPIDDERLEPVQALEPSPPPVPMEAEGLSSDELAALEEESDWSLNVEVGTRSDLDEDLGPGKWVESGRSPEELARELDSMPVVDREFDLNPSSPALPRLLAGAGVILLGLVGFWMMSGSSEESAVQPEAASIEPVIPVEEIPEGMPSTTVTTNLEHARVTLDGVEYGRAPAGIPIPEDTEVHRLCVEYRSKSRCVDLRAEELAARDPFQITVE